MAEMIKVGMADLKTCKTPDILTTLGLGSCVGIVLYDPSKKIAGLAHIMLPDSTQIRNNSNKAKFADTAIDVLIDEMISMGARKDRLVAKLAGGAQMFSFNSSNDLMKIGLRNAEASKKILKALNIRILSEDTGENYGRTIEFNSDNGELLIKTIGKEPKTI
ncbi:chemotaxis protein CheD [Natranaerovirga hydrolytica]|uniref:Probable chemoreceptor glutamine deamidase CheD n=1 Tax=Natranaerovirga hydrolytica TaxID=680378 RepID=A0A4R1MXD1_9FIRM|nr:chemotaxis protein CheD [Natranaerovirga hydrolytica]TCK97917.1 chemotaxis protein CheD [Natranaerovirga hydrolytica]